MDGALDGTPFTAPLSFPAGTTRFAVTLPDGDSGQLSLSVAALDGNGCPRATTQTQVAIGDWLRHIAEAEAPLTPVAPPYCPTPRLDAVTPALGRNVTPTQLSLTGENFALGASVSVGGVACGSVSVVSSTQITCVVPARPVTCGAEPVVVKNPDQQMAARANGFSFFTSQFTLSAATPAMQTVQSGPRGAAAADFNGDGKMDLVVLNQTSSSFSLLLGNGDGSFRAATNITTDSNPNDLGVADFDGDTKPDVVVADTNSGSLGLYLGDGSGGFQPVRTISQVGQGLASLAIGDLNGDGLADVVLGSSTKAQLYVILGNGDGTFHVSRQYTALGLTLGVAIADANGNYGSAYIGWGAATCRRSNHGHLDRSAAFRFAS